MKIRNIYLIIPVFFFLLGSCEKKKEKVTDRNTASQKITIRTLGLAYLEENNLDEAETEFKKLIELDPNESLGYANLGLVYVRMGKYSDAEKQLKKAIELDPKNPDIRLILSKSYELNGQRDLAEKTLKEVIKISPDNIKALYSLADLYSRATDRKSLQTRKKYLEEVVKNTPANVVPRLQLIEVMIRLGDTDSALKQLETIQKIFPEPPKEALAYYIKTLKLLRENKPEEALTSMRIFHNFIKLSNPYQAGVQELKGPGGALIGFPVITFGEPVSAITREGETVLEALRFTDVTETAGLNIIKKEKNTPGHLTVADYDGDGDQDIYFGTSSERPDNRPFLLNNELGKFNDVAESAGITHTGSENAAIFADYDNDGHLDLYVVRKTGNLLYKNDGDGKFSDVTKVSGTGIKESGNSVIFFDPDQEGDLDIYLSNSGPNKLFRNNADGTFTEMAEKMGITGGDADSRNAVFADFDDDGDIDLFVANSNAENIFFDNLREGKFKNITSTAGLSGNITTSNVALGDYNNDGYPDLFIPDAKGKNSAIYHNNGNKTFIKDTKNNAVFKSMDNLSTQDARFFDFDNDGALDLLVVGIPGTKGQRGLFLFHNDGWGNYKDVSDMLPGSITAAHQIAIADYNEDGDLDIFLAGVDGKLYLIRNDGGNANHHLKIQLVGLRTGSGKNNYFGIGAKIEVRAGNLYQMQVVTGPTVHFGLGAHSKADVVRILWTNGVPQNIFTPGSDQDLVEEQELKGSCPFLYTWNGSEFAFVKDMMWRSALGMPMGIMGGNTTYAFADAAQENLLITGEVLQEKDGSYPLRITAELWETMYFDQVRLTAIDHPDSVELYVDERFSPPPYPPLKIYSVSRKYYPVRVTDGEGNDLRDYVIKKDDRYISAFNPGKYQGITEMKSLILDPGNAPVDNQAVLVLQGWIFPTDASINAALSQSGNIKLISPELQVTDRQGKWKTVDHISFPMGKDKTIVVELAGKYLTSDHRIRINTNMEIYWDHIFFAENLPGAMVRSTVLNPASAELHYRGFSRTYRKGGRYGPHWFDYNDVSTEPKWRDLTGFYTRFGDILPLLMQPDDQYVIMNAGDEMKIEFPVKDAPVIPRGWKRDFLLYSNGWVKDGDLNTATGQTVEPLPFHGMKYYPYGPEIHYPDDEAHRNYLKEYNIRYVDGDHFRRAVFSRQPG